MDLRVAGVGEVGAALARRPPVGGDVRAHRVRGEEEDVAVAAGGQHDSVAQPGLNSAGDEVAGDDATGASLCDDELQHLVPGVHLHRAGVDLTLEGLVGADQKLLAGLAAGVEGALHLDAAEGAVVQQAAVLTGERDALRDALVDDVRADLGQPVDVGLPGAVVAALDGVVKQPVGGVVVVAVVLGSVDAALGCDRVRPTRAVLVAEVQDVVAGLAQAGRSGAAGQAGAHDDDRQLAAVGGVDQLGGELALGPLLVDRASGCLGVGDLGSDTEEVGGGRGLGCRSHQLIHPKRTATGMIMKPMNRMSATAQAQASRTTLALGLVLAPSVAKALQKPWRMCMQTVTIQIA